MARILIVDDSPDVRLALATILEDAGHEIIEAEDGDEENRYRQIGCWLRFYCIKSFVFIYDCGCYRDTRGVESVGK